MKNFLLSLLFVLGCCIPAWSQTIFTGTLTSGSAVVSSVSSISGLSIGTQVVTCTGCPANATLIAIGSTNVTLSAPATAGGIVTLTAQAAQSGFTLLFGQHIYGPNGLPLAVGVIRFTPTTPFGAPVGFSIGGSSTGQSVVYPPFQFPVVNGVISSNPGIYIPGTTTLLAPQIPDTSLTNPKNICYAITLVNSAGKNVLGPGYSTVQPTGSTWNFDTFSPNQPANALVALGPQGPVGATGPITGEQLADTAAGVDGGARIDTAANNVGSGAVIRATPANGSITSPVNLNQPGQTLYLLPGLTTFSAQITISGQGASIRCDPATTNTGPSLAGGCYLQEIPGSNLSPAIVMSGNETSLVNVTIDGQQFAAVMYATLVTGGTGYTGSGVFATVVGCTTPPVIYFPIVGGAVVANGNGETIYRGAGCTSPAPTCSIAGAGSGATCTVTFGPNLNPTAGGCIQMTGVRPKLENVNTMRCGKTGGYGATSGYGIKSGDETLTNGGAAFTLHGVMSMLNQGPNLYMVNVADWFIGEHSEFENGLSENVRACNAATGRWGTYDIGGGNDVGLYIGGVASGYSGAFGHCATTIAIHPISGEWMMVADGQFGNNLKTDIQIDGYDTTHSGAVALYNQIGGASFIGSYARGLYYYHTYPAILENGGGQNIFSLNSVHDDFGNGSFSGTFIATDPGTNELLPDIWANNIANINTTCYTGISNTNGQTQMSTNLCNGARSLDTGLNAASPTLNGVLYNNSTPIITYTVATTGCGTPTIKAGTSIDSPNTLSGYFVPTSASSCTATLTFTVNSSIPAPGAWVCNAKDVTNSTNFVQSGTAPTTCTVSGTTGSSSDFIVFDAHTVH